MASAVSALSVWNSDKYKGEPDGWNRAMTENEHGIKDMFRRRPDLTKESEHIAP